MEPGSERHGIVVAHLLEGFDESGLEPKSNFSRRTSRIFRIETLSLGMGYANPPSNLGFLHRCRLPGKPQNLPAFKSNRWPLSAQNPVVLAQITHLGSGRLTMLPSTALVGAMRLAGGTG